MTFNPPDLKPTTSLLLEIPENQKQNKNIFDFTGPLPIYSALYFLTTTALTILTSLTRIIHSHRFFKHNKFIIIFL